MTTEMIQQAKDLARRSHAGQVDKSGNEYIDHPRRVAGYASELAPDGEFGQDVQATAWLHDVVEDTEVTLGDLRQIFPEQICAGVDAMTKRAGESLEDYCARVAADPIAAIVKKADVKDNTDPQRVALLSEATRQRLAAKYARVLELLG